jgi:hypothetical protein
MEMPNFSSHTIITGNRIDYKVAMFEESEIQAYKRNSQKYLKQGIYYTP